MGRPFVRGLQVLQGNAREARVVVSLNLTHEVPVWKLRLLLDQLDDADILVPNRVANLSIQREGEYIGFVDLLYEQQHIELFDEQV